MDVALNGISDYMLALGYTNRNTHSLVIVTFS